MPINVLVVDDSLVMRSMIIKTIKMCGLPINEIHQADNGANGLKILDDNWIDLVIVDINMPVMSGEEMIDHMKQNPEIKEIPVIIISTEGSSTRIERLKNKGAKFIRKPFTPESIRDTVNSLIALGDSNE